MRAERPGADGRKESPAAPTDGFERALRRAREGEGREARRKPPGRSETPSATSAPAPGAGATAPPAPTPTPASAPADGAAAGAQASRSAELASRAVAAVTALRVGGQPALQIAAADGLRYEVAGGAGGVELRAVAPPLLERVARADLHAVAGGCDRRGVPLLRATVRVEAGGGRGAAGGKR